MIHRGADSDLDAKQFAESQKSIKLNVLCHNLHGDSRGSHLAALPGGTPESAGRPISKCVFLTAVPITKLLARGEGEWRTCATRDDELRPVWTSLPITYCCVCLLLQYLLQSCSRGGIKHNAAHGRLRIKGGYS